METETETQNTVSDALESASRWSKVSKKTIQRRSHFYWLAGGVVAIFFVLMISSHHKTDNQINHKANENKATYSTALNANLARLRELAKQTPKPVISNVGVATPLISPPISKEMLARQNAPTSMYSAPVVASFQRQSLSRAQSATLVGQDADTALTNTHALTSTVEATAIAHPSFTIVSGEFLHAVLETAINSDLPGMVRAVVSKPAYSYTGERTIIPAGSRLIGQYSSGIVQGQHRVMIVWHRIVLPNGVTVFLNSPGADSLGRVGQSGDQVNTHFFMRFGQGALLSLIGAGTATVGVNNADQYNSATAYRTAIAQSFQQSAQQSLQGSLPMKPTIHVYQGANINVFVAQDLSFYRVLKHDIDLPDPMPAIVK